MQNGQNIQVNMVDTNVTQILMFFLYVFSRFILSYTELYFISIDGGIVFWIMHGINIIL